MTIKESKIKSVRVKTYMRNAIKYCFKILNAFKIDKRINIVAASRQYLEISKLIQ